MENTQNKKIKREVDHELETIVKSLEDEIKTSDACNISGGVAIDDDPIECVLQEHELQVQDNIAEEYFIF